MRLRSKLKDKSMRKFHNIFHSILFIYERDQLFELDKSYKLFNIDNFYI